jgi:hypothetical protein
LILLIIEQVKSHENQSYYIGRKLISGAINQAANENLGKYQQLKNLKKSIKQGAHNEI